MKLRNLCINYFILPLFSLGGTIVQAQNYDITVARDGSGDYTTVQAAVDAAPSNSSARTEIFIKNGTYYEVIDIPSNKTNLTFIGESVNGTVLTYDNYASKINPETGSTYGTSGSSSTFINGSGFYALNITFSNTAGPSAGQAVAVRSTADKAIFKNCRFLGNQDTYYPHSGRSYHEDCYFEGTTDFIFGGAIAFFENCEIYTKGGAAITAASTPSHVEYGYVFNNCQITGSGTDITDLGRPWGDYASVTFLNTSMSGAVSAVGWNDWGDPAKQATARYSEYNNSGAGYVPSSRPSWVDILSSSQAQAYTKLNVLKANSANPQVVDNWNPDNTINSVPGGGGSAFATIQAESYSSMSGVQTESCSEGGLNVGFIHNGDWIRFDDVDFGAGADGFTARVASNTSGGTIEIRIDGASGTLIGSCSVSGTGGWQSWATVNASASGVSGVHDLYLVFTGGSGYLLNLNHFSFTASASGISEGTYSIIARHSGKAMEVYDFSTENGGNVVQWDYWGGDFQKWRIISVGGGYYRIENVGSGRSLDVENASTANGANIQQWGYGSGGSHKEFSFEDVGGGYYRITPRHSNKCIDVSGTSTADGANIHQWEYLGGQNQQWQLNHLGGLRAASEMAQEVRSTPKTTLIYPNPTSGKITIALDQFDAPVNVRVTDLEGKVVFSRMIDADEVDLSHLGKGVYMVSFISGKVSRSGKLVIED